MRLTFLSIVLLISQTASAQTFMVKNVTLFDGEKVSKNMSVLVEDGLIAKVARKIKTDVTTIDGKGKFLMPAMTNSHVHAWAPASLSEAAEAGVLNLMDMHGIEQFQAMMAKLNDSTEYANYFYAGPAATAPEGHGTQFGFPVPTLTAEDQAEGFVNDRLKAGASYIKIIVEPSRETLSHEIVKAVIEAAHAKETNVVVHISKMEDAYKVLKNGADGLVHIWWDRPMDAGKIKELGEGRNFFVIPTLLTTKLALRKVREKNSEKEYMSDAEVFGEVKKLYDAGVPILAGTDPPNLDINYGTDLYAELELMWKAGIPMIDVLKGATSLPAKYFRLGNTGEIKQGYNADMILLEANPIEDLRAIAKITTIWKKGQEVERE